MAQRPIWRGHLRLALVSCPVALFSVRHDRANLRFHLINPDTGHRIRMITQDAETGEELRRADLIKGYEFRKNTYVLLTEEDFDSVKVESSSVMVVEKFVEGASIDPIYYDTSYYVAPDGEAGRDVYAVLREAIAQTGHMALSRVVIGQRERTVALRPGAEGLVAHTLYEQRDINEAKPLFEGSGEIKTDPAMVQLARQLIERQVDRYDPADLEDRYETRLRALIDAKLQGEGVGADRAVAEPDHSNVIDLMAALQKSLGQTPDAAPTKRSARKADSKADRKPTAKKAPAKPRTQPVRTTRKRG